MPYDLHMHKKKAYESSLNVNCDRCKKKVMINVVCSIENGTVGETLPRGGVNHESRKFSICTPSPPPVQDHIRPYDHNFF